MWWVVIAVVVPVVVLALLRLLARRPAQWGRRPSISLGGLLPAATSVITRSGSGHGGQHRGTHGARRRRGGHQ